MKNFAKSVLKLAGIYKVIVRIYIMINPRIYISRKREEELHKIYKNKISEIFSQKLKAIQVGANNGIANDPLRKYIVDFHWEAILIEPAPDIFDKLKALYEDSANVVTLNAAISPSTCALKFYVVDPRAKQELGPRLPLWFDQLGSFDRTNIVKHLEGILEDYIVEIDVEMLTLNEVIEKYNFQGFDVLHVDAEGYDIEVMETIDLEKYTPKYIIIEHKHLEESKKQFFIDKMRRRGYVADIYFDDILFSLS